MRMHVTRTRWQVACVGLLALMVSGPAQAVDGVIEINQAKVKVGGVTPGDAPLFPAIISQPGSYRLTGNLDVTDASARPAGTAAENTTAILVTADYVTIDLNGFMIKGPTVCLGSGSSLTCSPTGSGNGINATVAGVAVMNGTVQGMGNVGVYLFDFNKPSQVEKVRALNNGSHGIQANTVANCTANRNGAWGIYTAEGVTGCTADSNRNSGIFATSTVANCTASGNGNYGINATMVTNCTANFNTGIGIYAASTATNCTANSNTVNGIQGSTVTNCTAISNGAKGIEAVTVANCTAQYNSTGISATTATGCTATGNALVDISANGIAGHNICGPGSSTWPCP